MKKSLTALAVLAATSGGAWAQSSVTLFGTVDATLKFGRGTVADRNYMGSSGLTSSKLGFRGTEDLGGGMTAGFHLEAGVNNDDGTGAATDANNQALPTPSAPAGTQGLTFNRRSTVSLSGGFGELRLGRDYTPQFMNHTVFDPFGTNGAATSFTLLGSAAVYGATGGSTTGPAVRASNSIGYILPAGLGGFYGQLQYYLGENVSNAANKKSGTGAGLRFGYGAGPLNVALAASSTAYHATEGGDRRSVNIGGSYNLGVVNLMAHYDTDKNDSLKNKSFLVGAVVPVGAGEFKAAYSQYKLDAPGNPRARLLAVGYVHNLSKRTALYTTLARASNNSASRQALNGASTGLGDASTGLDIGLRHNF